MPTIIKVTGPPSPEFNTDAYYTDAYFIRLTEVIFISMYVVAIWDWAVNLRRESRYIWKQSWSPVMVLYLGCRYWVILMMPIVLWVYTSEVHTPETCKKLYNIPPLLSMWNQLFAEALLLIRTHAFLRQKSVLIAMIIGLTIVAAFQLSVGIWGMTPFLFPMTPSGTGPCLPVEKYQNTDLIMGWFLAPLLFDTIVTCLTIWRAIQLWKDTGRLGGRLMQTFLREGINYFIFISIANIINGVFKALPKLTMRGMLVPFSIVLPDLLACRMILDLREQGDPSYSTTPSDIVSTTIAPRIPAGYQMNKPKWTNPTDTELSEYDASTNTGTSNDHRRYPAVTAHEDAVLNTRTLSRHSTGVRVDVERVEYRI